MASDCCKSESRRRQSESPRVRRQRAQCAADSRRRCDGRGATRWRHGIFRRRWALSISGGESTPATDAGGAFSPSDLDLKLGTEGYSPALLRKVEYAGANLPSFPQASRALARLADVSVSPKHVQRLTERLGSERKRARDEEVAAFRERRSKPRHKEPPHVVAVHVDAGKLQLRADDGKPGVREPRWTDAKVACCATYASSPSSEDPQPNPPATFLDPPKVARLCAEMERVRGQPSLDRPKEETPPSNSTKLAPVAKQSPKAAPRPLIRTAIATLGDSEAFGWLVAAEAHKRGFYEAKQRAVVGDGGNWIGPLGDTHFPGWLQVLDFLHLLVHLYAAALAAWADDIARAWPLYLALLRDAWSGRVTNVTRRLRREIDRLARAPRNTAFAKARKTIELTLNYVRQNAARMDYPRYRRLGLPVSSSMVESLIKQFNQRVKGTEKFWVRDRAEAMLQCRAAFLSQDDRAESFFARRELPRAVGSRRLRAVA